MSGPVLTFDMKVLRAKVAKAKRAEPEARIGAARDLAHTAGLVYRQISRRDTGRYVNGWLSAVRDVGADAPAIPLRPGQAMTGVQQRLDAQLVTARARLYLLEKELRERERAKRKGTYYLDRLRKRIEAQKERIARAEEFRQIYKSDPTAIVVFAKRGSVNALSRVFSTTYGGNGRFVTGPNFAYADLTNREPHARIVDAKFGTTRQVMTLIRSVGGKVATGKYWATVKQRSGLR